MKVVIVDYGMGNVRSVASALKFLNVTDIIIIIDHITQNLLIENDHQLLLADINFDNNINITDIILVIDLIIE